MDAGKAGAPMILGDLGGIPTAPRSPLGLPLPEPTALDAANSFGYTPPKEPVQPVLQPGSPTQSLVPERMQDPEKPVKTVKPGRPDKNRRELQDYSYDLSQPELARVRQEEPTASETVSTEMTAAPLTWDAYDKLTPDQRAAVDFNSLLVQAREIDLKTDPKFYSDEDKKKYAADVESIFGTAGGSDTIGYQTVELLKRIDFTAIGQDLDEYLSLERGVGAKSLKNFTFSKDDAETLNAFSPELSIAPTQYAGVRSDANMAALDTTAIQAALTAYKTKSAAVGANARDIMSGLGIQLPAPMMMPAGYERAGERNQKMDQSLKDAYDFLRTNPNEAGMAALFQDFKARNWTPEDQQMLWNYLDERTMREIQYSADTASKQIRDALGWK